MGWLFTHRPRGLPVVDWLVRDGHLLPRDTDEVKWAVLASSLLRRSELYVAIEKRNVVTGERVVFAAVYLVRFTRGEYNFGYKDMTEDMGPLAADCPARILNLLTHTDNHHAQDWRSRCWANIERRQARRKLAPGDRVSLGGHWYRIDTVRGRRGYIVTQAGSGQQYRLSLARSLEADDIQRGATT